MDYYNEIKNELIKNEVNKRVKDYSKNKYELERYYNVGKLLVKAQGGEERANYGDGLIKKIALKLTQELGKGYSTTSLKNMRNFYLISKSQALPDQLTWSHYCELLQLNDMGKMNYYINLTIKLNLSYRKLHEKIKLKEYERLPNSTKNKLINKEVPNVEDYVKNPIVIRKSKNYEIVSEKILKQIILDDIDSFMSELGNGFSYVGNEYKIKIGNTYNYIDLLLFNIEYNCYVVVELKVTELKKEHIGQIQVYMNYIDNNLKRIYQDKTIGIIICKEDNQYIIKYSSDDRILSRTYELVYF